MNQKIAILWRCRQIDGTVAEVLIPAGEDPHDYFLADKSAGSPQIADQIQTKTIMEFAKATGGEK